MMSFTLNHHKDWRYPTEIHPDECLSPLGGREKFSVLDGDYVMRMSNVCERIMRYLDRYTRLSGPSDAELIADFVVSTYFMDTLVYAPRLLIRGATNSGKSTLINILGELCYRGNLTGDTTEASLFRMIDSCSVTPLLDEYQDYDPSAQSGIKKILKNGNIRGRTVQRTEKLGNGPSFARSYDVFAPVAFVYQAGGREIPEEVINRSVTITMISRRDSDIPMRPDEDELREIRDELYTIKWLWLAKPLYVGVGRVYDQALSELQDPEGVVLGDRRIRFSSRCRDILGTMYTVSKLTGTEGPVLRYFEEMQRVSEDGDRDSDLGLVFIALMNVIKSQMGAYNTHRSPGEVLLEVTTFDVARQYELLMATEGELSSNSKVSTRTVTNMLKDMGFTFVRDRNTNRSLFSPLNLSSNFQVNLFKYGTEEQRAMYGELPTTEHRPTAKPVVSAKCQTAESPNNLTTRGD